MKFPTNINRWKPLLSPEYLRFRKLGATAIGRVDRQIPSCPRNPDASAQMLRQPGAQGRPLVKTLPCRVTTIEPCGGWTTSRPLTSCRSIAQFEIHASIDAISATRTVVVLAAF
jgi:hypothetical protein